MSQIYAEKIALMNMNAGAEVYFDQYFNKTLLHDINVLINRGELVNCIISCVHIYNIFHLLFISCKPG